MGGRRIWILVGVLVLLGAAAAASWWLIRSGGEEAPADPPRQKMELNVRSLSAAIAMDMATGAARVRRIYSPEARARAERAFVTLELEDVDWTVVMDLAADKAELEWDWRRIDEEWVAWVHLPGEEWTPPAGRDD